MKIQNICVVGAGRMGRQIALCAAFHGYGATVYDVNPAVLDDMRAWEDEYLAGRIKKGRMTEEQVAKARSLFHISTDLKEACKDAQIVIEAIYEDYDAKCAVFRQLNEVTGKDVILATNSSFMVSSRFKDCIDNPSRLCNMHFYNPVLVMLFVEVVQGEHTSEETARAAYEFCLSLGKKPVWMKKELSGFLGNHIIAEMSKRTSWLVQDEYCTFQEADIAMEDGCGRKMGPFHSVDLTGLDLTFTMKKATYKRTGVKPDLYDLYEEKVNQGRLGIKAGHGFYDYAEPYTVKLFRDRSNVDPKARTVRQIAVIGANEAGCRIALYCAMNGFPVALFDPDPATNKAASFWIRDTLADMIAGSKLTAEKAKETRANFRVARTLETACVRADLIIENTADEEVPKKKMLSKLSALIEKDTILATNSLRFLSSQLAGSVKNPARFCNLHFYGPELENKFVEIVQGPHTDKNSAGAIYDFLLKTDKKPVWVQKEPPCLVGTYLMDGIALACRFLVGEGYCSFEEVDIGMEYGMSFKAGYFRIADETGIDVCFRQLDEEYRKTGNKPEMYDTFKELCDQGRLGKKCGHGFYDYV